VCEQGVVLKSYQVEDFVEKEESQYFGYYKGHRFDHIDHNWILFSEFVSLSFSFMTFVIRDKHQTADDLDDFSFDVTIYSFNINRKTFLTCDNFVSTNHEMLDDALKKLSVKDPQLLEQLHYYYEQE
jgi:hypothetical protein